MKIVAGFAFALLLAVAPHTTAYAADGAIKLVAAENFYGDIAHQIGGARSRWSASLSNPNQDPHLFETSPAVVRDIAGAKIVIYNGADYDPWMPKLLNAAPYQGALIIVAADLVHKKAGDNPHLWYEPATMPAVAKALAEALSKADPDHAADYKMRLGQFPRIAQAG